MQIELKWSTFPGFDNYLICSNGDIYKFDLKKTPCIKKVKCSTDSDGYLVCHLNGVNGRKHFKAHRLLATCFIDNPNQYPQINHKDGIKTNNSLDNLEWCTVRENTIHAVKTGLRKAISGDDHYTRRRMIKV